MRFSLYTHILSKTLNSAWLYTINFLSHSILSMHFQQCSMLKVYLDNHKKLGGKNLNDELWPYLYLQRRKKINGSLSKGVYEAKLVFSLVLVSVVFPRIEFPYSIYFMIVDFSIGSFRSFCWVMTKVQRLFSDAHVVTKIP